MLAAVPQCWPPRLQNFTFSIHSIFLDAPSRYGNWQDITGAIIDSSYQSDPLLILDVQNK